MTVLGNGKPTVKDLLDIAKVYHLSLKTCQSIIDHIQKVIVENKMDDI